MAENKNSAARIAANNRYNAKAYDRINVAIPKGQKLKVKSCADNLGESVNSYISKAIALRANLTYYAEGFVKIPGTDEAARQSVKKAREHFLSIERFYIAEANELPDEEPGEEPGGDSIFSDDTSHCID